MDKEQHDTRGKQPYRPKPIKINPPAPEKPNTQPLIRNDGNQACDKQHRQGVHTDSGDRDPECALAHNGGPMPCRSGGVRSVAIVKAATTNIASPAPATARTATTTPNGGWAASAR